ncbi:hypothetical protein S40293_01062 [Stachybotrys chartarum IBT 40293]|nr:hypothetical protein S40293_01062 [Stachybotrys chartarum IBT 40293]
MSATRVSPPTVVVIGAGVVGLTCGLQLQHLVQDVPLQNRPVILLVARDWPSSTPGASSVDYASMWAGAHVRPIPPTTPQLQREARWLKHTVAEFARQVETEPWLGVTRTPGVEYLEAPDAGYAAQTKESFDEETGLPGYRRLGEDELPRGVVLGYEYGTFCVNAPLYCANLLRKFVLQGGKTLTKELKSEWEAYAVRPNVRLVVNASGTGFGDAKCFPTRGQTVITNFTSATKTVTRQDKDGSWSFIIPRFFDGGTIVGGTKEPHDWRTEPSDHTRQRLLAAGQKLGRYAGDASLWTETSGVGVIADVVGRRPTRHGGMRVEVEEGEVGEWIGHVVHAYGAGGRGYEISWGVAREVVELAKPFLMGETGTKAKL